jgi:hypothetical protein
LKLVLGALAVFAAGGAEGGSAEYLATAAGARARRIHVRTSGGLWF